MSAFYDHIRSFVSNRLQAFDPTIDLSPDSPAQLEVVEPLIARLGVDPFEIDIKSFIVQRIEEQYPELAVNMGELEDLVINPLVLLLEPLKQELNKISLSQSLRNADLMDDDEVDALADNWFETRDEGGYATGSARLYFSTPQNVSITTAKRFSSKSGLYFNPVQDQTFTSSEMIFNREGDLYYLDINLIAEEPGDDYNIDKQEIIAVDDINGIIKVTNLLPFSDGAPRENNTEFTARVEQALTERSLVTKRGVVARVNKLYSSIRAIQVIGAGEEGMNRDILEGTGEGFIHLTGSAIVFGNWVLVNQVSYKDVGIQKNIVVSVGDTIRFHKVLNLDPNRLITQCKVTKVLWNLGDLYFLEVDKTLGNAIPGFVAILKPGYITISKIPGGMLQTSVPDNQVHLGGHSDIYIRPAGDRKLTATIKNVSDSNPLIPLIAGQTTINTNLFTTVAPDPIDLSLAGARKGDSLVIETGTQAGTYRILDVAATIRVDALFTASEINLRARIVRNITENLNEPKTIKLPFNAIVNDLRTTIGSPLFVLDTTNIQNFGAVVGDIIEILDGPDIGKFTIVGFDSLLGGQGPIVNKPATATGAKLRYKVYSLQTGLEFPIVRIQDIEVLDTSNQSTGIKVPYGDAVDIRAICDFEAAKPPTTVLDKMAFLFPDTAAYWTNLPDVFGVAGAGVDARYSQKLENYDGHVRTFPANNANPITTIELNLPPFLYDGLKNTILGFTTYKDPNFPIDPSNNPRTSPIAEAKIGDSITLLSGPNAGTYLISDIRVLEPWGRSSAGHHKIGLIQIDGEFPMDPIKNCIDFIAFGNANGSGVAAITDIELLKMIEYSTDWSNVIGFYEGTLLPRLRDTFIFYGFPATTNNTRDILNSISLTGYTIGPSSHGMLRCFFKDPVSVELFSNASNPTLFERLSSDSVPKRARITTDIKNGQLLPQSFEDSNINEWLRNGSMEYPATISFYLTSGATFAKRGVETGDTLEFYPAINDFPSRGVMNSSFICCTLAGSNIITFILPNVPNNPTTLKAGQWVFIDSGPDTGVYQIVEVIASTFPDFRAKVNKIMTYTTLPFPTTQISVTGTVVNATNRLNDAPLVFNANVTVNDYVTIYAASSTTILTNGNDTAYLGTFKVTNGGNGFVLLDRTANFPANADVRYVVHGAPTEVPKETTGGGKEISNQFVRFRSYDAIKQTRLITINWNLVPNPLDPASTDQIILDTSLTTLNSTTLFTHKSPFRIIRKWLKKIPSTTMALNQDKGLYYFDVPVISIGLGDEFNFKEDTAFKFAGNRKIHGYLYSVADENLSFSTKEITDLILPVSILPVGSTPSQENELKLAGQNIQLIYDNASIVDELQRFFDSPLDRVVNSNPLIRHFLPAYVYLDIEYVGGSSSDVVYTDLKDLINNITPDDNELRVDAIARILQKRTAKQVKMPIELVALVHGLDRKIRAIRSKNAIGIDFPVFKGVNKMVYFIGGSNTSEQDPRPTGEQIYLKRS